MSLATAPRKYERKAKVESERIQIQPVLKTQDSPCRDNRRDPKNVKNGIAQAMAMGWEYYLNPLEYE